MLNKRFLSTGQRFITFSFSALLVVSSCKVQQTPVAAWKPYDESEMLAQSQKNENVRMRYKLIQSKVLDKNILLKTIAGQLKGFSGNDYQTLKPLILEQDIPSMQRSVDEGKLSYENLTRWYLYRIFKMESDPATALNNVISINPDAVAEARNKDKNKAKGLPLFGMPVLIKDNIDKEGLPTTAGAHAFLNNKPANSFIVDRLEENGAIILGKTNLSEWANYLCLVCPNGYSAVGGQTLNPYGLRKFDTGGSSSGSGSAIAANYAAAAVGTETSGSILSPSSSNSIVGLKPTTGLLSRSGIVPISGTFDTPGPMTRNVTDNAIMLSAMSGRDQTDAATAASPENITYSKAITSTSLNGIRLGVYASLLKDSIYKVSVDQLRKAGATIVEVEPGPAALDGFGAILDADMKQDLPAYIKAHASKNISYGSVSDIMTFNDRDSTISIPYGQGRFTGIMKTNISNDSLIRLRANVRKAGVNYFGADLQSGKLDAILSVANRSAGYAAAANYPCITVPMGYRQNGEPAGITFIGRTFAEKKLLQIAYAFEQATHARKIPEKYK